MTLDEIRENMEKDYRGAGTPESKALLLLGLTIHALIQKADERDAAERETWAR